MSSPSPPTAKPKRKKKKKSDKKKKDNKESELIKLSTWPRQEKKIKLVYEQDTKDDKELIEKIHDLNRFEVSIEDFLSLNGDVSVYGWQHVMNFALYEKYNFLLPLLKENLDEDSFQTLVDDKTHGLKDFVYVYCTILTLIMRRIKPQDRSIALLSEFLNSFSASIETAINEAIDETNAKDEAKDFIVYPKGRPPVTPAATSAADPPAERSAAADPAATSADPPAETPAPAKTAAEPPADPLAFKIEKAIGDGNCLFDAILISLNKDGETNDWKEPFKSRFENIWNKSKIKKNRAQNFRVELANYLQGDENTFDILYDPQSTINDKEQHKAHLKRNGEKGLPEYGVTVDIMLIANFFDICVDVWNNSWANFYTVTEKDSDLNFLVQEKHKKYCQSKKKAYIYYNGDFHDEGHFDAYIKQKPEKKNKN